jgi:multiple sugar transport system ATP-binding protein
VAANIGFPLKVAGVKKPERERRVREAAELLGLMEYLDRKPGQLSGGQRQRVAMGRAIVREASVFLMDEPLSNLDAKLRVQMRADIAQLQARLAVTTVYVTHDQAEAMTLGHRVAVLHEGVLQQCAPPRQLYDHPANRFVAGFIGSPAMNFLTVAPGANGSVSVGGVELPLPGELEGKDVVVGVRPESLELAADGIGAEVQMVEDVGADAYVFCTSDHGKLVARASVRRAPERGERVALRPVAGEAHLFDPETGARLG